MAPRVGLEPTTDRLTADCSTNWAIEECMERETRFELATPALARRCSTAELFPHVHGASGQNRTVDTRIFSPLLYQLSYRGTFFCKKKWRPRSDLNWRSSPWQGDMLTATPRGRVSTLVDYSYILTWGNLLMQVLFSNFLMNFSKIYEIRNYLLKIANISHLYLVCLNILQIIPIITEIKNACKTDTFSDLWLS